MNSKDIESQINEIIDFGRANTDAKLIALSILSLVNKLDTDEEIKVLRGWRKIAHKTIERQNELIKSRTKSLNNLTEDYNDMFTQAQKYRNKTTELIQQIRSNMCKKDCKKCSNKCNEYSYLKILMEKL